ncbi:hypothetical protein ABZ439_04875 [Streptomyces sp. NPDC005840]
MIDIDPLRPDQGPDAPWELTGADTTRPGTLRAIAQLVSVLL